LRSAGFDSVDQVADLNKADLEAALLRFGKRAENADVALIYFAGHGIEAGGENYLIPTDAKLERDRDLDVEATRLDTALRMGEAARMRIVILDACRNNPFLASMQRSTRSRAVGRGLAAIEPDGETLVVYAAKAGATASDGDGANSPFASALANRIVEPGLEIGIMFRSVRDDVLKQTNREQEPFTYGSLSGNAFYFVPPRTAAAGTATSRPAASDESLFWQGAMAANTATGYRDYLARYPKGQFAGLAKDSLARLTPPLPSPILSPGAAASTGLVVGQSRYDNGVFPNMARAFTANGHAMRPAGEVAENVARFAFKPDRGLRSRLRDKMLDGYGKPGNAYRAQFEALYPKNEPFRLALPFVAQYGLSIDNAADAAFALFESYRRQGTAEWQPPTPLQADMARKQISLAMARDPFFKTMKGADLQAASDGMWFTAAANIYVEQGIARQSRAAQREFGDRIAGAIEQILGFSIATLRLTDDGYMTFVPKPTPTPK
jgi:Caspase domain